MPTWISDKSRNQIIGVMNSLSSLSIFGKSLNQLSYEVFEYPDVRAKRITSLIDDLNAEHDLMALMRKLLLKGSDNPESVEARVCRALALGFSSSLTQDALRKNSIGGSEMSVGHQLKKVCVADDLEAIKGFIRSGAPKEFQEVIDIAAHICSNLMEEDSRDQKAVILRYPFMFTEAENRLNLPTQAQIQANPEQFGTPSDAVEPGDIRLPEGVKTQKLPEKRVENEGVPEPVTTTFPPRQEASEPIISTDTHRPPVIIEPTQPVMQTPIQQEVPIVVQTVPEEAPWVHEAESTEQAKQVKRASVLATRPRR